jgi:uncharacterized protein (DUF2147 family)
MFQLRFRLLQWPLAIVLLLVVQLASAQDIVGLWKTVDDETGKDRSVVEIYKKGDKYYGKIVKVFLFPGEKDGAVCEKCNDDRKNKPVLGLEIIRGLQAKGSEFKDGNILDPNNGKIYDCTLWVENGVLKVRGYIAFLHRTQNWYKYSQ